jgi:hypothetical protein
MSFLTKFLAWCLALEHFFKDCGIAGQSPSFKLSWPLRGWHWTVSKQKAPGRTSWKCWCGWTAGHMLPCEGPARSTLLLKRLCLFTVGIWADGQSLWLSVLILTLWPALGGSHRAEARDPAKERTDTTLVTDLGLPSPLHALKQRIFSTDVHR